MSEREDRLIEAVAEAITHELRMRADKRSEWWPLIERQARAAIAAVRAEDDGLEALLERASAVRHIDVYRQVPSHGGWRAWAYTPEGEVNRGDATFTGAIRAAVEAAIREGNAE